jgi:Flp pilus assembly protein TadD
MKRLFLLPLLLLATACDPEPQPAQTTPLAQAEALKAKRDYPAAIAVLEAARQSAGEDPDVVRLLVDLYQRQGDEARAIVRAKAGLAANPDARELYVPLANLHFNIKQVDEALLVLAEARKRGIDDANVSMLMGACLANKEDIAGARQEFERARAAGAPDDRASMNLGLLLLQENKTAEALKSFEALLAKYPNMAGAKREVARLLLAGVGEQAKNGAPVDKAAVDRAMKLLVDVKDELAADWRVHEALGDGFFLEGDLESALLSYTEALKQGRNPKSVEERYRVAKKALNDRQRAAAESKPPAK